MRSALDMLPIVVIGQQIGTAHIGQKSPHLGRLLYTEIYRVDVAGLVTLLAYGGPRMGVVIRPILRQVIVAKNIEEYRGVAA